MFSGFQQRDTSYKYIFRLWSNSSPYADLNGANEELEEIEGTVERTQSEVSKLEMESEARPAS